MLVLWIQWELWRNEEEEKRVSDPLSWSPMWEKWRDQQVVGGKQCRESHFGHAYPITVVGLSLDNLILIIKKYLLFLHFSAKNALRWQTQFLFLKDFTLCQRYIFFCCLNNLVNSGAKNQSHMDIFHYLWNFRHYKKSILEHKIWLSRHSVFKV